MHCQFVLREPLDIYDTKFSVVICVMFIFTGLTNQVMLDGPVSLTATEKRKYAQMSMYTRAHALRKRTTA